jgi:hypothetical protein
MKLKKDQTKLHDRIGIIVLLIIGLCFLTACSSDYGVLRTDPEVTKTFKSRNPYPGYNYYFTRNAIHPQAIMGIDKEYTLKSKIWTEVDSSGVSLEQLLERVLMSKYTSLYGANLISPDDKKMGVWFSPSSGATIKMGSEYEIEYVRIWPIESPEGARGNRYISP